MACTLRATAVRCLAPRGRRQNRVMGWPRSKAVLCAHLGALALSSVWQTSRVQASENLHLGQGRGDTRNDGRYSTD